MKLKSIFYDGNQQVKEEWQVYLAENREMLCVIEPTKDQYVTSFWTTSATIFRDFKKLTIKNLIVEIHPQLLGK